MAMPRCDGGTSLTTMPSISSVPPVIFSSPAIIRRSVDLPQPEGPTKTISSPFQAGHASLLPLTPELASPEPGEKSIIG
jgi:hypothetical protein